LLERHSEDDDQYLQASLRHAMAEREELKLLLDEVYKHLAEFPPA
jgi:hypothetical protein